VKLLLRADVEGVGRRGDIVEVADGFGRNFLVPKGKAVVATPGVATQAESMRRSRAAEEVAARDAAQEVASRLVATPITVTAHAGAEGRLFGSVTQTDLSAAVLEQTGIEIDRKAFQLDEHIKETGTHAVVVKLHADVEFPVTVEVVAG
jgi:large subunit ribosomal protein L9